MKHELGIIGAGNMAEAIVRGVTARGILRANQIVAADPSPQRRELFESLLKVKTFDENAAAARDARAILLSVKPQQMAAALEGIGAAIDPGSLVISIAAGIGTSFIEKHLGSAHHWRVIRAMPNTPMLVGQGMTALARGANATPADVTFARRIFESAGVVIDVDEDKMNAVTALSGSGPAYFFYLVEQMIRAAVELGMTPQQAHTLATKTAQGAAAMLTTSHDSPQELRRKVTSPGGTTQAAIESLESRHVGQSIVDAIKAATRRGQELGQ